MGRSEVPNQARRLSRDDIRKLTAQARALADRGPTPDEFADNDPKALVASLYGKMPKGVPQEAETATIATPASRRMQ